MYCFSSDMNVEISSGEIKRMDELKVNDWILSAKNADVILNVFKQRTMEN